MGVDPEMMKRASTMMKNLHIKSWWRTCHPIKLWRKSTSTATNNEKYESRRPWKGDYRVPLSISMFEFPNSQHVKLCAHATWNAFPGGQSPAPIQLCIHRTKHPYAILPVLLTVSWQTDLSSIASPIQRLFDTCAYPLVQDISEATLSPHCRTHLNASAWSFPVASQRRCGLLHCLISIPVSRQNGWRRNHEHVCDRMWPMFSKDPRRVWTWRRKALADLLETCENRFFRVRHGYGLSQAPGKSRYIGRVILTKYSTEYTATWTFFIMIQFYEFCITIHRELLVVYLQLLYDF